MLKMDPIYNITDVVLEFLEKDAGKNVTIINGGMGDFIAMEGFLTTEEKESFDVVYQIGYRPPSYKSLFLSHPHINEYRFFWNCLEQKEKTWAVQNTILKAMRDSDVKQTFISTDVFQDVKDGIRTWSNSSFIENKLANIDKFNLPKNYITICPLTINATEVWKYRQFKKQAWNDVIYFLEDTNQIGVVIGVTSPQIDFYPFPKHELLIDLSDQTTILEAIEITKSSQGYIGVDTVFCVVASKTISSNRIWIQTNKEIGLLWENNYVYLAPKGGHLVLSQQGFPVEEMKSKWKSDKLLFA